MLPGSWDDAGRISAAPVVVEGCGDERMTHLSKEETAAQILAVIQAKFERPSASEIEDILDRARQQLHSSAPALQPCPPERERFQLRILRRPDPTQT
jgi:hypothetical protein